MEKVYNKDVFDFLKEVDDNSIDLILTDPPYNMNKEYWDKFDNLEKFLEFTYKWIDMCIPKLKENGSIYIFNNPFNSAFILTYLHNRGLNYKNTIIWNRKDGISSSKKRYNQNQEQILFFTKNNKDYTFNYDDIREPYESVDRIKAASKKGILKNGKRWFPNENGKLCSDVWNFSSERHKNKVNGKVVKMDHVTPKPKDLIERIILASSNKGDVVMDPFVGMGTTAIVSKKNGRNFIVNDFDEKNIEITNKTLTEIKLI
jgi:site-specific DNA-methyltransferase (adenine-specific)